MEILAIMASVVGLTSLGVSILTFNRNGKKEALEASNKVVILEQKIISMQEIINNHNLNDLSALRQSVQGLEKRVEKLDTDVEKKIDNLSNKMDILADKMQELLIQLSKFKS